MGPKSFYDLIYPSLSMSLITGIHPILMIKKKKEKQLYTSNCMFAFNAFYLLTYYILLVIAKRESTTITSNNYYKSNKVSNNGMAFIFIGGIIYLSTIYISGILRTKSIKTTLEKIAKVDQALEKLGQDLKYKKALVYQLVTQIFSFAMITAIMSFQRYNIPREGLRHISLPTWFVLVFPNYIVNFFSNQFAYFVLLTRQRFQMINEQLGRINAEKSTKYSDLMHFPNFFGGKLGEHKHLKTLAKIKILMQLHDELCDITKSINVNYKTQLMLNMVSQYGNMIFAAFYFYWMHSIKPYSSLCWILWAIVKFSEILHITISCEIALRSAHRTAVEVHKILIKSCDIEIKKRLMEFSNQLMHQKVKFTIWGMLNINATLLFSIISSTATFMIIMLQFQQASLPMKCKATVLVQENS